MAFDPPLAWIVRCTETSGLPGRVETCGAALDMIRGLDKAGDARLHWRLAARVLQIASLSRQPEDVELATEALENALKTDGWLRAE